MTKKQVSTYVDEDEERTWKAHAGAADVPLSEWVRRACRDRIERDVLVDDAGRYRVEQRLLALVDDAADRAAERIVEEVLAELAEAGAVGEGDYDDWGESEGGG